MFVKVRGNYVELQERESKVGRIINEIICACLGAVCGLLFIVIGTAAWIIFETDLQAFLRNLQKILFG